MKNADHAIVLLAAGASTRLGKPKQLLIYNGKSLLKQAIDLALGSKANPVVIVLGAHAEQLIKEATQPGVHVIKNERWKEGMASSLNAGLNEVLRISPGINNVLFMVCDQPFVTKELLQTMLKEYELTRQPMIACEYDDSIGTPALFNKTVFALLFELEGEEGAKKLLKAYPELVATVDFPDGNVDIDTVSDYDDLVGVNEIKKYKE